MPTELYTTTGLLEAPLVQPDGGVLFSNVTGGGVFRHHDGETTTVVDRRRGVGGLAQHTDGGLIMTGRDLAYADADGFHPVLTVDGATGFNDVVVGPDGSLYVGVLRHRPQQGESAGPSEVLRIDPSGAVTTAAADIHWPNGLGFSPDEQILYICEYAESRILAVQDGHTRVFATAPTGECDGLAVDAEGGVWVALGSGSAVAHFTPSGTLHKTITLPDGFASSVALHGTTLYITTSGRLLSEHVETPGLPIPSTRIPHDTAAR